MKKLWDLKKVFSNLELEGQGRGIIMGGTRLLLLGPFYTIQTNFMNFFAHDCTWLFNCDFKAIINSRWKSFSGERFFVINDKALVSKDAVKQCNWIKNYFWWNISARRLDINEAFIVRTKNKESYISDFSSVFPPCFFKS